MGDYREFVLKDPATGWEYAVAVTAAGGHIMQVDLRGRTDGSLAKLLEKAEALVARWAQFEGATLTQLQG
ncbi:MAG: hypothetical protein AB1445_04035 [Bacillota bacterium]